MSWFSKKRPPEDKGVLDEFFDIYQRGTPRERDEVDKKLLGFATLLGFSEKEVANLQSLSSTERSPFFEKAKALELLKRDYDQAVKDSPEHSKDLEALYEKERRKIVDS